MELDYKSVCSELFGTTDIEELKQIANTIHKKNPRGAGRKKMFTDAQIQEMRQMQSNGIPQQEIAMCFKTTRQTVARCLRDDFTDTYTLKIDYMYKQRVCTIIFVDFWNHKIKITNKTPDILHRAFGINENPTWEDFQIFLTDRCFPKSRGDKKSVLESLQLDSYDPMQIVERTKGKTYEDRQWMRFEYRRAYGTNSTI